MSDHDNLTEAPINVFGEALQPCSFKPLTGYLRDGYCNTGADDIGSHTVCAQMTEEYLEFSVQRGNDLITPNPEHDFPGLKPGDLWCMCAERWLEAVAFDKAPKIYLARTHQRALDVVPLEMLRRHAIDLN